MRSRREFRVILLGSGSDCGMKKKTGRTGGGGKEGKIEKVVVRGGRK